MNGDQKWTATTTEEEVIDVLKDIRALLEVLIDLKRVQLKKEGIK